VHSYLEAANGQRRLIRGEASEYTLEVVHTSVGGRGAAASMHCVPGVPLNAPRFVLLLLLLLLFMHCSTNARRSSRGCGYSNPHIQAGVWCVMTNILQWFVSFFSFFLLYFFSFIHRAVVHPTAKINDNITACVHAMLCERVLLHMFCVIDALLLPPLFPPRCPPSSLRSSHHAEWTRSGGDVLQCL
jgi:hypothetical protein